MKALLHTRLVNFRIGNYVFSPGIIATLATAALLYIMVSMAQWQSGKAEYKDKLHESIVARKDLAPVSLDELPQGLEERLFMPVQVSGRFDPDHYFLLDNRIYDGQVGYDVYAPVRLADGAVILVNRGFVPQGRSRQQLPHINIPEGTVRLKGLLDSTPPKGFVLADNVNQSKGWPRVLQYIDLDEIQGFLDSKMFAMILWLDPNDPASFAGSQPALNMDSAKNSGYAFQWYAMTVALTGIYFFVNIKKKPIQ